MNQGELVRLLPNINVTGTMGCQCGCQGTGMNVPTFNMPSFSCNSFGGGPLFRINFGGNPVCYGSPDLSAGIGFPDYLNGTFMPFNKTMCLPQMAPNFGFNPMIQFMQMALMMQQKREMDNMFMGIASELVQKAIADGMNGKRNNPFDALKNEKPIILCIDDNGNLVDATDEKPLKRKLDVDDSDLADEKPTDNKDAKPPKNSTAKPTKQTGVKTPAMTSKKSTTEPPRTPDRKKTAEPKKENSTKPTQAVTTKPSKETDEKRPAEPPKGNGAEPPKETIDEEKIKKVKQSVLTKLKDEWILSDKKLTHIKDKLEKLNDAEFIKLLKSDNFINDLTEAVYYKSNRYIVGNYVLERLSSLAPEGKKLTLEDRTWPKSNSLKLEYRVDPRFDKDYKKVDLNNPIGDIKIDEDIFKKYCEKLVAVIN